MARTPDRLAFIFALVLAMAVTVVAIKAWAGPPDPEGDFGFADPAAGNDLPAAALESVLKVSAGNSREVMDRTETIRAARASRLLLARGG